LSSSLRFIASESAEWSGLPRSSNSEAKPTDGAKFLHNDDYIQHIAVSHSNARHYSVECQESE
jgi:hypothetical protein